MMTTAGYDRRGDLAKRKAVYVVHMPFFCGWPEQAATEVIAPAHPAENQQDRLRSPFWKESSYMGAVQSALVRCSAACTAPTVLLNEALRAGVRPQVFFYLPLVFCLHSYDDPSVSIHIS